MWALDDPKNRRNSLGVVAHFLECGEFTLTADHWPPTEISFFMATPTSTRSRSGGGTFSSPRRSPGSAEYDVVRLLAQKEDLERRIAERDERNNELQKKLSRAETRAREVSDSLVAERAERQLAEETSARMIQALKLEAERQQAVVAHLEADGQSAKQTISNLALAKRDALAQLKDAHKQIDSLSEDVVHLESIVDEFHAERARRDAIDVKNEQERRSLQQALAAAQAKLAARAPVYVNERPSRRVVAAPALVDERSVLVGSRCVIVPIL